MAENFRIIVGKSNMYFSRAQTEMISGGDLVSKEITLQYYNGSGQSVLANDILHTEGTIGNMDFFEISAKNNHNFIGDNFIDVIIRIQVIITPGGYAEFNPSILSSPPFSLRVYHPL